MSEIPSGWKKTTINGVGKVVTGNTPPTKDRENYGDDILFIGPADLGDCVRVFRTKKKLSKIGFEKTRKLPPKTPMMVCIGSLGKTGITTDWSATNQQVNAVICNVKNHPEYVLYNLHFNGAKVKAAAGKQVMDMLNKSNFEQIAILQPPFEEQTKIAEILTSVDDVIKLTEKEIEKLQMLKKGMMQDLLAKGIGHTKFEDSPVGRIPASWSVRKLDELVTLFNGNSFNAADWKSSGLPIIRIQNLNGGLDFNYYQGEVDHKWHIFPDDLLFAWSGQRGRSFGARFWKGPEGVLNQHIFKVKIKGEKEISTKFMYLRLVDLTKKIESDAHGFKDSFMHIKKSDLVNLWISVPPTNEQELIVDIFDKNQTQIEAVSERLLKLNNLKKALMADLLTGKVRVNV